MTLLSRFGGASRLITRLGMYMAPAPDGSQFAHSMQNIVGFSVSSLDGTKTCVCAVAGLPLAPWPGLEPRDESHIAPFERR